MAIAQFRTKEVQFRLIGPRRTTREEGDFAQQKCSGNVIDSVVVFSTESDPNQHAVLAASEAYVTRRLLNDLYRTAGVRNIRYEIRKIVL